MVNQRYWPDNTTYFLTGSTFLHFPYFRSDEQKQLFLYQINKAQERFGISNLIFSIAINHYHLKFHLKSGLDLAKIKQLLHGGTFFEYKKRYPMMYKEIWQSSRIYQIRTEEVDFKVTGYIIGNLLKHKEVGTFNELINNHFSSYRDVVMQIGEEAARKMVYSTIDLDIEDGIK